MASFNSSATEALGGANASAGSDTGPSLMANPARPAIPNTGLPNMGPINPAPMPAATMPQPVMPQPVMPPSAPAVSPAPQTMPGFSKPGPAGLGSVNPPPFSPPPLAPRALGSGAAPAPATNSLAQRNPSISDQMAAVRKMKAESAKTQMPAASASAPATPNPLAEKSDLPKLPKLPPKPLQRPTVVARPAAQSLFPARPIAQDADYEWDFAKHTLTPDDEAARVIAKKSEDWSSTDALKAMNSRLYVNQDMRTEMDRHALGERVQQWFERVYDAPDAPKRSDLHNPDTRRSVDAALDARRGLTPPAAQKQAVTLSGIPEGASVSAGADNPPPSKSLLQEMADRETARLGPQTQGPQTSNVKVDPSEPSLEGNIPPFAMTPKDFTEMMPHVAADREGHARWSEREWAAYEAYQMKMQGGSPFGGLGHEGVMRGNPQERERQALLAAQQAYEAPANMRETKDFHDAVVDTLVARGVNKIAAEGIAVGVDASPVGKVVSGSQEAIRATEAALDGDFKGAAKYAGTTAAEVLGTGKAGKVLGAAGERLAKTADDLIPDGLEKQVLAESAKQGLTGKAALEATQRFLKAGGDPKEALVYGVLSAHAKESFQKAAEAVVGKGKDFAFERLSERQKSHLLGAVKSDLGQATREFSKNYSGDLIQHALDKLFDDFHFSK